MTKVTVAGDSSADLFVFEETEQTISRGASTICNRPLPKRIQKTYYFPLAKERTQAQWLQQTVSRTDRDAFGCSGGWNC